MAITIDGTNGLSSDNAALKLDGTTLAVDETNNRVGVGTASPAVAMDVVGQVRASTGILFGSDTAAANALDDYEEGTWTPTLGGQTTDPSSVTYIAQTGNYTKIGNVVCVFGRVSASAITGGSGFAIIKGLPFTLKNVNAGAGSFAFYSHVALNAGYTQMGLQPQANTTTVRFSKSGTSIAGFPASIGDLVSGGNFDCGFQITYEV